MFFAQGREVVRIMVVCRERGGEKTSRFLSLPLNTVHWKVEKGKVLTPKLLCSPATALAAQSMMRVLAGKSAKILVILGAARSDATKLVLYSKIRPDKKIGFSVSSSYI